MTCSPESTPGSLYNLVALDNGQLDKLFEEMKVLAANNLDEADRVTPVVREVAEPITSWQAPPHSVVMLRCAKRE